ncbi:MAG: lysophospholipid acyltransferase family protein [Stenotrophobium sp.]
MLALWRSARLIVHLLTGLLLAAAVKLDRRNRLRRERLMSGWCRGTLRILGIRVSIVGRPHDGARLTVANHVSWLDIMLIGACEPTRFVAKSEIRNWPVAGWLATATGAFYIRRGKGGARALLGTLTPWLAAGGAVTVFPEGTTTDGTGVRDFHPRLFAAAIAAAVPVQPVAIRYGLGAGGRKVAPFIGDDDLFSHVLRILREPALAAEVAYCAALDGAGRSREQLTLAARQCIADIIAPEPLCATSSADPIKHRDRAMALPRRGPTSCRLSPAPRRRPPADPCRRA